MFDKTSRFMFLTEKFFTVGSGTSFAKGSKGFKACHRGNSEELDKFICLIQYPYRPWGIYV